jgi:hypothetical protein
MVPRVLYHCLQYIEFSVAGSDGFDPVFYQPFDYVYNVTNPYW